MIYEFQCETAGCAMLFTVNGSMASPPRGNQRCPACGKAKTYRVFGCRNVIVKGQKSLNQLLDPKKPGLSTVSGTGTSMEAQRQAHGRHIDKCRAQARKVQKSRRNTRRKDDEQSHVGSMPVEVFRSAQRTRGRHFWKDTGNVRDVLKEFGMEFPN